MGCWTPPFGNPQVSLRYPDWPNSSPLRGWSFGAVGEGRERVRARHGRRTSTASVLGAAPPCPPRFPLGNVRRSCANAHGTTSVAAFAGNAFASLPEAPAAQRLGVPSLPSRELRAKHAPARPQGGIPKGAQPSLASLCLLSAGQKVGARRGLSASKGKDKIFKKHKKDNKRTIFKRGQRGRLSPPKTRKHTLRCAFLRRSTKFVILCRGEINRTDRVAASFFHPRKKGVMRKWIRIK